MFKKFRKIVFTFLFLLCFVSITVLAAGCSKEEPTTYSAAMGLEIRTYWPTEERLYYGAYNSPSVDDTENVLTAENNELTLDIEGCPGVSISIHFYIVNDKTGDYVKLIKPPEETRQIGKYFNYYGVKDEQDRWVETNLAHTIYDINWTDFYDRPTTNSYQLQRIESEHKIVFTSPYDNEYKVEETFFTLKLNLKGDNRESVWLEAAESDEYIKYGNVGGREVFIMKNSIDDGNAVIPEIGVYSQNGTVLTPAIPQNYHNNIEIPHVKSFFAKVDEFYKISMPGSYIGTEPPKESGIYLASFTYTGDETYQTEEYICYIIIPE